MGDSGEVLRGRQGEARRNDGAILAAALEVFARDPRAPMSAVAERAGVGQASLYRRYATREALLAAIAEHGMSEIRDRALSAAADTASLGEFLTWWATSGTTRLNALLGSFEPPDELYSLAHESNAAIDRLVARAHASGTLREGVSGADLTLIAGQIGSLELDDPARTRELRERYLALALEALRIAGGPPLPGRAPDSDELMGPWLRERSAPPAP